MENLITNFKDLQYKHKRQDVFQAMHGELSEDAMFIAYEEFKKKQDKIFKEMGDLIESETITTYSERIGLIAKRCDTLQEFSVMVFELGQIKAKGQMIGEAIKIFGGKSQDKPKDGE